MIGKDIRSKHPCMQYTDGYDYNLILKEFEDGKMIHAARVEDETAGRLLNIFSTQPGLQFYMCENLVDGVYSAFCLEPQHFPDAPHKPAFPSIVLDVSKPYVSKLLLALDTK